ncbi:MAG: ATP-binding cassette domain-containing protein, partial [Lentisphaeria bacterium]
MSSNPAITSETILDVRGLTMKYGRRIIQQDLNFSIIRGQVFVIMGGSGCGKSTLLRHLIGLQKPAAGEIWFSGENLWSLSQDRRDDLMRKIGVLYQRGGLWSSMTLAENIALPLREYT